jgi:hypothetical protein
MLDKLYKEIKLDNFGSIVKIYGSDEWIELEYDIPEWKKDENIPEEDQEVELCFKYNDRVYFLSEFMNLHNKIYCSNPPEWMKEFDGYMFDSFFSGILIKLDPSGEAVKVYTYIS